ncbi:MAG: glycosyltransferase family 4 protein [Candidatus Bilamarchaeaceae archaeon]
MPVDSLNILLLTRYFPPEIGTAANLFFELARGLSKRGHKITVVTGFPWYNLKEVPEKYNKGSFLREFQDGFEIIRIRAPVFGPHKLKLASGHLTAPICSVIGGLLVNNPHVIFLYSPPLFMGLSGWIVSIFKGVPFIMGVQDLHPQCYIDQGVLKNRFLIRVLETLEKFCYKKATLITVHSEGNKEHIVNIKGTDESKVRVLPNWIDTEEIMPLPRINWFSSKYELNDKFVVGYAGTLGMSQGLMSIIDGAKLLRNESDILFFIVGDGIEKGKMESEVKRLNLDNVRFLPMQPKDIYPWVLASSDVQLVTLNKKVKTPVVPSKILSIMAASRPVLASLPLDGDAPKLIKEAECGLCVEPEDPHGIAEAILKLKKDKGLRDKLSQSGRSFVEKHLSLNVIVESLEEILFEAINNR